MPVRPSSFAVRNSFHLPLKRLREYRSTEAPRSSLRPLGQRGAPAFAFAGVGVRRYTARACTSGLGFDHRLCDRRFRCGWADKLQLLLPLRTRASKPKSMLIRPVLQRDPSKPRAILCSGTHVRL